MTASPKSLLGHTSPVPASHDVSAGLRRSYLFEDLTSEDIRPLAAVATTLHHRWGVTSRRPFIRIGIRGHRRAARHHDYDSARAIWTGCIDARPALIARCRTTEDIAAAVTLTREVAVPLAGRAGGHSVAGLSTCDGGVVIDLSPMRGVSVDVDRRTATVQPGATWADLDAATPTAGLPRQVA
jgi:hypothetical protein